MILLNDISILTSWRSLADVVIGGPCTLLAAILLL